MPGRKTNRPNTSPRREKTAKRGPVPERKPSSEETPDERKPATREHPREDQAGRDRVDESSEESFPASDPPSWTP